MGSCFICGGASSKEHYIPQWLSTYSGRGAEPIHHKWIHEVRGSGSVPRGTAKNAILRCLCVKCNNTLGSTLEAKARAIICPLSVSEAAFQQVSLAVTCLTREERETLVHWTALRAIQFAPALLQGPVKNKIHNETRVKIVSSIAAIIDRKPAPLPPDLFLGAGYAERDGWNFGMTLTIKNFAGEYRKTNGSFMMGLQANRLLLVLACLPAGAFPDRSGGWRWAIHPSALNGRARFADLATMMEQCRVVA